MASFDALPYVDPEPSPEVLQRIDRLIAKEMKRGPPQSTEHPSLPPMPTLFDSNPLLAAALARAEQGDSAPPVDGLDTARYSLPTPSGSKANIEAWQEANDNAEAQLAHMASRRQNLDLMQAYAGNKWRIHNFILEKDIERAKAELERVRERTEEVNRNRKASQLEAGDRLSTLDARWQQLIGSNLQLEIANMGLEAEIADLERKESIFSERLKALEAA